MKAAKYIAIIGGILFGVVLIGIGYLGGYKDVKIESRSASSYQIWGKSYKGSVQDPSFGKLFSEMELKGKSAPNCTLVAYYSSEPTEQNGMYTEAFIGLLNGSTTYVDDGLELKEVMFKKSLYGYKNSHHIVSRIPLNLFKYAEEQGDTLDLEQQLEFYIAEDEIAMEIPYLD